MKYIQLYITREEKLWSLLVGCIVLLLFIYIAMLNYAVSETFRRGQIERQSKIVRQDLQKSEEVFATRLSDFYDQYSASFSQESVSKQEFVARNQNFALGREPNFR